MNYKIVPVTNSNRYVQYGASGKGVAEIQMWKTAVKKEQKKALGFCDRASWANCGVREKTNKMQQLDVYF